MKKIIFISLLSLFLFPTLFLAGCALKDKDRAVGETVVETVKVQEERKLVALGSSFTKANNLGSGKVGDSPEYSFSTGAKINSLYKYLKDKGENIIPINLASSGADTREILERQIPNAVSYHPKYITIDPGADIIIGTPVEKFEGNLSEIISQIKTDENIVAINTYPDFSKMRDASHFACKEDKLRLGVDKLTKERVELFNGVIKKVADEYNLLVVDLYNILGPEEVSDYDCLHINVQGQEKVAAQLADVLKWQK